ncbi:MAG TPA: multicopper oxidase domain-containing protein, partial [Cellvibrio sp.]
MPIAHFSDLHKASVSLALGCFALLSPITMADSAAIDAPAEVLKLDELKSVDVLQVRNPADYNANAPFKTARNNLTVAAQKGTEDVAYNLPIDYSDGTIYNPATGKHDKVHLRAYNGKFIAPAVIMNPGQTVRFNLINKLPVPKVNCARADMNTPAPPTCFNETNLHSHGLWISPTGNSDNVLLSIDPGVAFEYEYNVPADHPAGTFWYHPHTHGSTAMQVASGMSGALIVKGARKPTPESNGDIDTLLEPLVGAGGVEEEIKLLQQIPYACFDSKGKIKQTEKGIWICEDGDIGIVENFDLQVGDPNAWEKSGRYTLINGQARARINARAGQLYRWRLIDAGFNETVNLRIREIKSTKNSIELASAGELSKNSIEKTCNGTE